PPRHGWLRGGGRVAGRGDRRRIGSPNSAFGASPAARQRGNRRAHEQQRGRGSGRARTLGTHRRPLRHTPLVCYGGATLGWGCRPVKELRLDCCRDDSGQLIAWNGTLLNPENGSERPVRGLKPVTQQGTAGAPQPPNGEPAPN